MLPSDDAQRGKTLQSWKEIASFLGVTVRSVQRWEKTANLPIYRQGSGKKARVFAYADELQKWMESGAAESGEVTDEADRAPARPRRYWLAAIAVAVLALAGGSLWLAGVFARVPHSWALEGPRLRVIDARDRLCWEKRLGPLHASYRAEIEDLALIADIDDDGRNEVLFSFLPEDLAERGGSLMCFEHDGRLRWERRLGALKTFGGRSFTQAYVGRFIRSVRYGGKPRVLAVSNHFLWHPCQAALLDPQTGAVLEEYWHPGGARHCVLKDLDQDGTDEVLIGAINNPGEGLGHAGLAVLKLPFSKAPRQPASPEFPPLTGGGEAAYLMFPQADMCRVMGMLPTITNVGIEQNRRISVQIALPEGGAIVYYLDFNLNVQEFRFADNLAAVHSRYYVQHLLDHPLSDKERAALGRVMRFPAAPDGNSPELERLWRF